MKIRTRFLLFLLPTLIGSVALVSTLLTYSWHGEILDSFKARLKSTVITTASLIHPEDLQNTDLKDRLKKELSISDLYFIPIDSSLIPPLSKGMNITSIYNSSQNEKIMTGYSPIYDESENLLGLLAADINISLLNEKFHESLLLIILSAGLTILIMLSALFLITNKISRPIQKLNNAALALAAGQYGESIVLNGPKEIVELATTLNIMSECLLENINRLKENALLRERMYGEYECAMLLQHLMLQKNIDHCRSDAVAIKPITFFSETPRGLLLHFPKPNHPQLFHIHLAEAFEEGFEGMYQLLTKHEARKDTAKAQITLDRTASTITVKGPLSPFLWSLQKKRFLDLSSSPVEVDSGDFFFLFNQGLSQLCHTPQKISELLSKVLKVFAQDGLETTASMIQKELSFMTKRKELTEDVHLLCFQILS